MFNDTMLQSMANHAAGLITHLQLHSADPGLSGATFAVGSRVAATEVVDADGDITWSNVNFTGLTANQVVTHVSYWSASTAGTCYGVQALTGDNAANSAGEFTITSLAENGTSSTS